MIGVSLLLAAAISAPSYGVAITPSVVNGPQHSRTVFTIQDRGNVPETIAIQVVEMRPVKDSKAFAPYGEYANYSASPSQFKLNPGQSRSVTVTISSTDGLHHDLAVAAETIAAKGKTGARVSASVGAMFVVSGKHNPYAPSAVSQPQAPSSGLSPFVPIGAGIALLAILASLGAWLRRRRHPSEATDPYGRIP